jgi:hypothetical protein
MERACFSAICLEQVGADLPRLVLPFNADRHHLVVGVPSSA